jgi:hypothetical protein
LFSNIQSKFTASGAADKTGALWRVPVSIRQQASGHVTQV